MRIGLSSRPGACPAPYPFSPTPSRADDAALTAHLQQILDAYVKDRASIEGLSGVALQVDRGAGKPILAIYAGDNGLSDKKPIGPDTLFDIGSNTKEFTSALILKLEAAGKLNIDDTIGQWLPQYPAWKDVTIRSLLQMTSPIPNYSETVAIGEIEVADLHHQFSGKDLIGFVDPANGQHFPPAAGLVLFQHQLHPRGPDHRGGVRHELRAGADDDDPRAARAARHLLRRRAASGASGRRSCDGARAARALPAAGLPRCTSRSPATYRRSRRSSARTCGCRTAPGPAEAGAIISNPHDLASWIRALFEKRVIPAKQLEEMTTLVSNKTGLPLAGGLRR